MKTFLIASIIFLAITFSGNAQNKTHSLQKAEWLVGSWQGTYNGQPFYEAWRKLNDATMLNFTIEQGVELLAQVHWRNHEFSIIALLGEPGQVIEQLSRIASDLVVDCKQAEICVNA